MDILNKILVAIVGGLIGGFLTYLITVRAKRHEILITERLAAFKAIQAQLVELKRYCESRLAHHRLNSGGFSPRSPEVVPSSTGRAMNLTVDFKRVIDEYLVFMSRSANRTLFNVYIKLDRIRELEQSAEPEIEGDVQWDRMQHYSELHDSIEVSETALYKGLRLPK